MPEPRLLGKIVRLQIQRTPLKLGEKPNRWYDPAGLMTVNELTLTPQGAVARQPDGSPVPDIHHLAHPETRSSGLANTLSFGFTPHYAAMRGRYGAHMFDGCAGENILVATDRTVLLDEVRNGISIRCAGVAQPISLGGVRVARPCREFSAYAQEGPGAKALKEALQFLDNGMRGYWCRLDGETDAVITVGDEVWA
jgi:hypothetical protein